MNVVPEGFIRAASQDAPGQTSTVRVATEAAAATARSLRPSKGTPRQRVSVQGNTCMLYIIAQIGQEKLAQFQIRFLQIVLTGKESLSRSMSRCRYVFREKY